MATWRDGAEVFVEIAFGDDPLTATASCTWDDVTSYVRGVSISRGRSTELATYSPGTATISLDNRTRLFDPSNTAGTYYGELLPMKRIRVRAVVGVTSAVVFTGYVLGWPIEYPGMKDSVVQVNCVDAFRVLENSRLPESALSYEILSDSPTYYWPMQDLDAQASTPPRVGTDLLKAYPRSFANTPTLTSDVAPIGESSYLYGDVFTNPANLAMPAAIEFWTSGADTIATEGPTVRLAISNNDYAYIDVGTDGLRVGYSNTTTNRSVPIGSNDVPGVFTTEPLHVVVTYDATNLKLYINGTLYSTITLAVGTSTQLWTAGYGIAVASFGTSNTAFSHLAFYSSAPSAGRILEHYNAGAVAYGHPYGERGGVRIGRILDVVGWPAADRDLSTGETVLDAWTPDAGTPLAGCREIEAVEQGLFFVDGSGDIAFRDRQWQMTNSSSATSQATFGDGVGETPYQEISIDGNQIDFVRNLVVVSYSNGSASATDTASVTAYGEQADTLTASLMPASSANWLSQQLAAFRLRLRKDPKTRIPYVVAKPRTATSTHLPTRLNLELGERVTVKRRPSGGTGSFDLACTVQGIADTITPDEWVVRYYLSPANPMYSDGPYLTMGDATYGKIGAADGNLVPY